MEAAQRTPPAKGAGQKTLAAFFCKNAATTPAAAGSGASSSAKKVKHVAFSTPIERSMGEDLEISPSNKPAVVQPTSILVNKNEKLPGEKKKPANKRKQAAKDESKATTASKRGGGRKKQKAEEATGTVVEPLVDLTEEADTAAVEPEVVVAKEPVAEPVAEERQQQPTVVEETAVSQQNEVVAVEEQEPEVKQVEMDIPTTQDEEDPSSENSERQESSQAEDAGDTPASQPTATTDSEDKTASKKRKRSPKTKPIQLSFEEIEATMPEATLAQLKIIQERLQKTLDDARTAESAAVDEAGKETDRDIEVQAALEAAVSADVPAVVAAESELPSLAAIPPALDVAIARIIQGSPEPLSKITERVVQTFANELPEDSPHRAAATNAVLVAEKIKLLARRTNHGKKMSTQVAVLEDEEEAMLWRWEVHSLDHFPASHHEIIREKRKERAAYGRIVQALTAIIDMMYKPDPNESKIQAQEDKVGKAMGELAKIVEKRQVRVQKQKEKLQKEEERRQREEDKKRKEEEKKRKEEERKRKEEEKEAKKLEAEEARKRKKAEEEQKKLQQDEKARKREEEKLKKTKVVEAQRSSLMSFLKAPASAPASGANAGASSLSEGSTAAAAPSGEQSEATASDMQIEQAAPVQAVAQQRLTPAEIEALINTNVPKEVLTQQYRQQSKSKDSKRRRPEWVNTQVQARVSAGSNGFSTIEYVELRTVRLRNKMKYLHFAEDYRPPYFGTFSKRSTMLNGRRPDKKDEELFNYDYDSEAEWEEEEEGEDLGESEDGDEEPADDLVYDDFFCKDDDLGSDAGSDVDDIKVVNKRRSQPQNTEPVVIPPRFIISPTHCVVPTVEGHQCIDLDAHARVLSSVRAVRIATKKICVGVEAPAEPAAPMEAETEKEDGAAGAAGAADAEGGDSANGQQRAKLEECHIPALAELVHGSILGKDKLIDEFRVKYPTLPKLQIKKKIEEIASKHKPITGGPARWVVHQEVLDQFDLELTLPTAEAKQKTVRKRKPKTAAAASTPAEDVAADPTADDENKDPRPNEEQPAAPSTPVGQRKLAAFFQRSEPKSESEANDTDEVRGWEEAKDSEPMERLPDDFCVQQA